jgi:spore coat protein A, manganese oxidase
VISRREFLKRSGLMAAALAVPTPDAEQLETVPGLPKVDPSKLAAFVDPLPIPRLALPHGMRPSPENPHEQIPYYRVEMREFLVKLHRDLRPTRLWGYDSMSPGPIFEARSGSGMLVEWVNQLPKAHLLAIDHHIYGAEADKPDVRNNVHVHGAMVAPAADGYPDDWYAPGGSRLSYYPNRQNAAMLWYHDHALGITRLNVFAGLYGAWFIRSAEEGALGLPAGEYEVPLIICDRAIDRVGQLNYDIAPMYGAPWRPEVYGNLILVNGKILPYLAVEPRLYRLRIVNISNASFLSLTFSDRRRFHQIGSDQGLLRAPVHLDAIMLAPSERADLLMDFAPLAGSALVLQIDSSPAMQFRVASSSGVRADVAPATLRRIEKLAESSATRTRVLTLDQYNPPGKPMLMLLNGTHWESPATEDPVLDATEIWSFVNLTPDAHPIHLQAVRFQILDRREFDASIYRLSRSLHYTGPAIDAERDESGWKDTVRCPPNMVTRIIVRFDGPFSGRYVWHCHILEHEDNEMMRPLVIRPVDR